MGEKNFSAHLVAALEIGAAPTTSSHWPQFEELLFFYFAKSPLFPGYPLSSFTLETDSIFFLSQPTTAAAAPGTLTFVTLPFPFRREFFDFLFVVLSKFTKLCGLH